MSDWIEQVEETLRGKDVPDLEMRIIFAGITHKAAMELIRSNKLDSLNDTMARSACAGVEQWIHSRTTGGLDAARMVSQRIPGVEPWVALLGNCHVEDNAKQALTKLCETHPDAEPPIRKAALHAVNF